MDETEKEQHDGVYRSVELGKAFKAFNFARCSLCICTAAAMLAACGGPKWQPPVSETISQVGRGYRSVAQVDTDTFKSIFYFDNTDGDGPDTALVSIGDELYGTTIEGGGTSCSPGGCGTVFAVSSVGKERVLYGFEAGVGGNTPIALTILNGTLYGMTEVGGTYGYGTVFSLTTSGVERVRVPSLK